MERADQLTSALLIHGAAQDQLSSWPAESVQCCVTSPPYWGLRDYGLPPSIWLPADPRDCLEPICADGHEWGGDMRHSGGAGTQGSTSQRVGRQNVEVQTKVRDAGNFCARCGAWRGCLGLEPTPELFVEHIVTVFREVRRVLRDDGTLWLNLGDSYSDSGRGADVRSTLQGTRQNQAESRKTRVRETARTGLPAKNLIGVPWRVAFALQADGWYLRSEIIWHKPNPMPESVTDRPTKAHEQMFLLAKAPRYYYDADSIAEPASGFSKMPDGWDTGPGAHGSFHRDGREKGKRALGPKGAVATTDDAQSAGGRMGRGAGWRDDPANTPQTRNKRSVWTIAPQPFRGAHFATFPEKLAEPCILAGSRQGDLILDPFCGSGTTGVVSLKNGRRFLGIDQSLTYLNDIAAVRLKKETGIDPVIST